MYIKDSETLQSIPDGYKQVFKNKFSTSIAQFQILDMKNSGVLTERDLAITKLLFKHRFATLYQIYDYLKEIGMLTQKKAKEGEEVQETSINSIKSRLEKLVKNRILNEFMLSLIPDNRIESDALIIYCLDLGGKYLLKSYSDEDTSDWYSAMNYKASSHISKDLLITDFYLKLLHSCKSKVRYFEVKPLRKSEKINIIPSFEFGLMHNDKMRYFVCEVVREVDIPDHFTKKVDKLEKLIETNAWKKYFYDTDSAPVLMIIAEDDLLAKDCAKLVVNTTTITRYRISTDNKLKGELSDAFLLYDKDKDTLVPTHAGIFKE